MAAATMAGLLFSGARVDLNYDDVTLVVNSLTLINPGPFTITGTYTTPSGRSYTGTMAPGNPKTVAIPVADRPTLAGASGRLADLLPAGAQLLLSVSG